MWIIAMLPAKTCKSMIMSFSALAVNHYIQQRPHYHFDIDGGQFGLVPIVHDESGKKKGREVSLAALLKYTLNQPVLRIYHPEERGTRSDRDGCGIAGADGLPID